MALRLYVVRHGETAWTRERRYTGSRDVRLSAAGLREVRLVARALAGAPLSQVYASPLARARMSAEAIARPHRLPVRLEPAFREMGLGEWEGLTRDEAASRAPEAHARWQAEPHRVNPPGGETLAEVTARVGVAVNGLRARHDGETVVLVTHAIVIRLMLLAALDVPLERIWSIDVSPAAVTDLEYGPDATRVRGVNLPTRLAAGLALTSPR